MQFLRGEPHFSKKKNIRLPGGEPAMVLRYIQQRWMLVLPLLWNKGNTWPQADIDVQDIVKNNVQQKTRTRVPKLYYSTSTNGGCLDNKSPHLHLSIFQNLTPKYE